MNMHPPTPLAVPFRIDHFRFRRQAELDQQLGRSRLLQELIKAVGPDAGGKAAHADLQGAMLLPPGFIPKLDEAARHFHTIARLGCELELRLVSNDRGSLTCRAYRDGRKLVFGWPRLLLEGSSVPELLFHFAIAAYAAIETKMREHMFLLVREAPLPWPDRLAMLEASRLRRYAANCFALACTRDRELVLREDFRRFAGFNAAGVALDFQSLAAHHLREQDLTTERLVNEGLQEFTCHPLVGTVLERFIESVGYHACLGQDGGTPREQFEAEVLALDRQMHPPLDQIPTEQRAFAQRATVLATYQVMEQFAPVTPARLQMFLEFHGLEEPTLAKLAAECEWEPEKPQHAERRLWWLLYTKRVWANVHSAQLLSRVIEWTLREHGGMPDSLGSVIREVAELCRVSRSELDAIQEALQGAESPVQDKPTPPPGA